MQMNLTLTEGHAVFPPASRDQGLIAQFEGRLTERLEPDSQPVRFVATSSGAAGFHCEYSILDGIEGLLEPVLPSIFGFRRRAIERTGRFNVVLLIPTGIGAEQGGHAGDAGPVARLLSGVADTIILHPNVVNASDINEMPENALYVEGSVVTRLLMGTVGLQPVRANRVLVVLGAHADAYFVNAAINTVNGARATYGLSCPEIVCLEEPVRMRSRTTPSGRASGIVDNLEGLLAALLGRAGQFDAVALSSIVDVPADAHTAYFDSAGSMVNPWGGVEAMLTHALSLILDKPTAHSPMLESRSIADLDPGIVDARMAAEAVSTTFLQCTLKGLQRSPFIVTDAEAMRHHGIMTVEDISCLVIPDGCLGLPTLAALEQGITVVTVSENRNLMKNDLAQLPWKPGQLYQVHNYWEAAGVLTALRQGIDPATVRRPFDNARVSTAFGSTSASPNPHRDCREDSAHQEHVPAALPVTERPEAYTSEFDRTTA